jgi:subtilisin family serine protease
MGYYYASAWWSLYQPPPFLLLLLCTYFIVWFFIFVRLLQNRGMGLDMNVREAWAEGVTGKGTVVTILDDGLEKDHPDIRRNYVRQQKREFKWLDPFSE